MVRTATRPQITGSQPAAVVAKPQGASNFRWGLMAVAMAVSMIPVIGPGIGHLVDRHRNSTQAKDEKKALTGWYRNQIAAQLGVRPESVKLDDLELAAKTNPTFRAMLDRVEKEQNRSNRASLVGAAVATPFSVVGAGTLAAKATEVGVAVAAGTAASFMGKDYLLVDDVATHINQKRLTGEKVTAEDVFFLRLAHDKPLQDKLKAQNGTAFHKMTEAQQGSVLRGLPNEYFNYADGLARSVNEGRMTEQDLVIAASADETARIASAQPQGRWAARVGGPRAAQRGSFAEQVNASRATNQLGSGGIV